MSHDTFSQTNDESLVLRALDMLRRRKILAILNNAAVMASAVSLTRSTCRICADPRRFSSAEKPVPEVFVKPAVTGELESRLHVIKQEILSRAQADRPVSSRASISTGAAGPRLGRIAPRSDAARHRDRDRAGQLSGRKSTVSFRLSYTGANGQTINTRRDERDCHCVAQERPDPHPGRDTYADALSEGATGGNVKRSAGSSTRIGCGRTSSHPGGLRSGRESEGTSAAIERLNTQLRLNGERQLKLMEDRGKIAEECRRLVVV